MRSNAVPYSSPRFGAERMPQRSTAIWRAVRRRKMVSSASRVTSGLKPRSMSLAPSSRMTASVPSGTDQSSRASPSEAVSPDTPAFWIAAAMPLAARAAKGIAAAIQNAGVSGDTASDGLARLDWSVPDGTEAVILELGANDMLRGFKPQVTRDALDTILRRLAARHIAVLL